MFWNKTLEAKLSEVEDKDLKAIAKAEQAMEQNRPELESLYAASLQRQAMLNVKSEAPGPRNQIRDKFLESMKTEQESDTARMRELAEPLAEVERIRQAVAGRRASVVYAVMGWLGRMSPMLPENELRSIRERLETAATMRDLLNFALPLVREIEENPGIECRLFRFENIAIAILGEAAA
jgi:hypothetical protein